MKIDIRVTEVLSRVVSVDADSIDEAINSVEDMYKNQKIVLDDADFHELVTIEKKEKYYKSRKDVLTDELIQYMIHDEKKHFEELYKPNQHIYKTLLEL